MTYPCQGKFRVVVRILIICKSVFYDIYTIICLFFFQTSKMMVGVYTLEGGAWKGGSGPPRLYALNPPMPFPPLSVFMPHPCQSSFIIGDKTFIVYFPLSEKWWHMALHNYESYAYDAPYRFVASLSGTYWYHSHLGTQRTQGAYGPFIVLENPAENNFRVRSYYII